MGEIYHNKEKLIGYLEVCACSLILYKYYQLGIYVLYLTSKWYIIKPILTSGKQTKVFVNV